MLFRKKKHHVVALVIGGLFVLLGSILASNIFLPANTTKKHQTLHAVVVVRVPTPLLFAPIATPSPTLVPTPVYTGYCLNVPVLMYHHIGPWAIEQEKGHTSLAVDNGIFDEQMNYLSTHGYTTLFADDLIHALVTHMPLPAKSIIVTADDGYDDIYTYAFPTAKKYNIKLSLMVPTGLLGVTSGSNSYYTWGQLQEMVHSGLARAYNHTWSHYAMASISPDKDQYEVMTAQQQLQQYMGTVYPLFTYPYGTNAGNIGVHTLLQKDGFAGAFSTISGTYQCDSFIYSLHRTRIGSSIFPGFGIY